MLARTLISIKLPESHLNVMRLVRRRPGGVCEICGFAKLFPMLTVGGWLLS